MCVLTCTPCAPSEANAPGPAGAVAVAGLGISWLVKNLGILDSTAQAEELASTVGWVVHLAAPAGSPGACALWQVRGLLA